MAVSLSDVLYDGESVVERVDLGENAVVVTTNRVVALTPRGDDERVQYVDRPNVERVHVATAGDATHLLDAVRWTAVAVLLVGLGYAVNLDAIADSVAGATAAVREVGLAGLEGLFAAVALVARYADDAVLLLGALTALAAAVGYARYLASRTRALVVETYGGDELRVPAPDADQSAVARVLEALN